MENEYDRFCIDCKRTTTAVEFFGLPLIRAERRYKEGIVCSSCDSDRRHIKYRLELKKNKLSEPGGFRINRTITS